MAEIIRQGCSGEIDCADAYHYFLEDLGTLIADHFGGDRGAVSFDPVDGWMVAFDINECVPPDGGVYKSYDPDVIWKNGEEL